MVADLLLAADGALRAAGQHVLLDPSKVELTTARENPERWVADHLGQSDQPVERGGVGDGNAGEVAPGAVWPGAEGRSEKVGAPVRNNVAGTLGRMQPPGISRRLTGR